MADINKVDKRNKKGAVIMIVVWSAIAVLLAALVVMLAVTGGFEGLFGEPRVVATAEMDGDAFDSVEISWKAGKVEVTRSADGLMHLTQRSRYNVEELEYGVENGRLVLRDRSGWGLIFFGIGSRSSDLELQLPDKEYEEFLLSMSSGSSSLDGVAAGTMQLKLTSGRLTGSGLSAGSLEARMTSGNMKVAGAASDSLRVEITSGKAEFSGSFSSVEGEATSGTVRIDTDVVPEALNGKLTSGRMVFTIPDCDGFSLYCRKSSGSLKSDFDLLQSVSDKNQYVYGAGGPAYNTQLTSGTLELRRAGQT